MEHDPLFWGILGLFVLFLLLDFTDHWYTVVRCDILQKEIDNLKEHSIRQHDRIKFLESKN